MTEKQTSNILEYFGELSDPRSGNNVQHPLINLIAIAICGAICGADTWTDIESFGPAKRDFLGTFLALSKGIPSHDTFGRVCRGLDPEEFGQCFQAWTPAICHLTQGEVVAIDGKCLRGSKDGKHERSGLYLVSAWASQNRLVLAQEKVDEKSNEITAIPTLLKLLDLRDCIITLDATGCQTEIAQLIIDQGADYVLAVKGNQGTLLHDIELTFASPQVQTSADYYRQYDQSHGRAVVRECWVITDPAILAYINDYKVWPGIQSIIKAMLRSGEGDRMTVETRYFIASLRRDAQTMLHFIRAHWLIENQLHWVLDIAFREDDSRIRRDHAPHNMALLRPMALHLLKHETSLKIGVKAKRLRAGWDNQYLLNVLATSI